ncbi:gene transfer agent family protein [Sphingomonas quercus]|uniref:Gene transfer agent family protein n=1 Tax=Sphingomonas quercus TaxID=2842451 RepID=A0ABS6BJI3_9SPHN|nr:gene transfer agent family protein [Sphingomonas quercus]
MNPARGETAIAVGGQDITLRPSFAALVAAEQELGSLFALVERAAEGRLMLHEMVALFWHCAVPAEGELSRERLGEAVTEVGLVGAAPVLKALIGEILKGR